MAVVLFAESLRSLTTKAVFCVFVLSVFLDLINFCSRRPAHRQKALEDHRCPAPLFLLIIVLTYTSYSEIYGLDKDTGKKRHCESSIKIPRSLAH